MTKYSLISYDLSTATIIACFPFENLHDDLNIDCNNNPNVPFAVGSNQTIVKWDDDGPIYETECTLCGNHSICKEYFKVDLKEEIMVALGIDGRYGVPLCVNTCYKKIDALMHTEHGRF